MTKYLHIALPVNIEGFLTYHYDGEVENLVGLRVEVKLRNKKIIGIILEICKDKPDFKTLPILEIIDEEPIFSNELIQLYKWIAAYYQCNIGEVVNLVLNTDFQPKRTIHYSLADDYKELMSSLKISQLESKILKELGTSTKPLDLKGIEKKLEFRLTPTQINKFKSSPLFKSDESKLLNREIKKLYCYSINTKIIKSKAILDQILIELSQKSPKMALVLESIYIKEIELNRGVLQKEIDQVFSSFSYLKKLTEKLYINFSPISQSEIDGLDKINYKNELLFPLNEEQESAFNTIKRSIFEKKFNVFLLHGVTGSGKTLVYMKLIEKTIEQNQTVLYLLPEIALTPQIVSRIKTSFGEQVGVIHSKLDSNSRKETYSRLLNGEIKIIIGTRSSLFVPINKLGLIIVDEEHDSSFKQYEPNPRYNARDASIYLAKLNNATIVLGSATPSIESYNNAQLGKYKLIEIHKRADNATMPNVKIIDLHNATKNKQLKGIFSNDLIELIRDRLHKREQILLFLNRKGYAGYLQCSECNEVMKCKNCDVSLTYYKRTNLLKCHYCNYTEAKTDTCKNCNQISLIEASSGTERAEEDLNLILKELNLNPVIKRFDADEINTLNKSKKVISSFEKGEIDILIGTQMISKGLNFPKLTLVGLLNADISLYTPDFRASERTYQLITQVSGRAGRTRKYPGTVVIQTYHPTHYSIATAGSNDYSNFYNQEIQLRDKLQFPPFAKLVQIKLSSTDLSTVEKEANLLYSLFPINLSYLQVFEPQKSPIAIINNRHQRVITIKYMKSLSESSDFIRILKNVRTKFEKSNPKSRVYFDIDAMSFM